MQNINLLSFFTHLAINIFFAVKKRLKIGGNIQYRRRYSTGLNTALSVILISVVVGTNIYSLGTIVEYNYETGASRAQLIDLLQNQKAEAQMMTPHFKIPAPVDKPAADPKNKSQINLASARYTEDSFPSSTNSGSNAAKKSADEDYRAVTIKKGGTLWEATRQLLYEFMGDDPCAEIGSVPASGCRDGLDKMINTQTQRYLRMNGLLSHKSAKTLTIQPGTIVIMDRYGNITVQN